ncbi:hypothetical protein [Burkholderia vietnamiensis]|uniref:hypothetical protein n=1 Tax=Burkholderia vietnamiensis TaxID=60552 RepID=UPI000A463FE1|nr:hypothetical protein [Burkholderia vietnamiensis]MBR8082961.1 hypothetical protein [Burkholderia vietnamiensis]MDN7666374.1 hypothetical protein [Burkholderia vietnamiensis]HDR8952639.1 hypothetical protein [Burkholderia vietnamiensis]
MQKRPAARQKGPRKRPVTKWVSNVAMQVTSKNNHKKFGNIWGCFRMKYLATRSKEMAGMQQ